MDLIRFGGGNRHQSARAKERRKTREQIQRYGSVTSYSDTSSPITPSGGKVYPTSPSRTTSGSVFSFSPQDIAASHNTTSGFVLDRDRFVRNSPDPELSPAPEPKLTNTKRKADEAHLSEAESDKGLTEAEIVAKELALKAKASEKLRPTSSEKNKEHNANVRDAREQCRKRGIKWD